jgi:Site-specific recombinase XerD
MGVKLKEKTPGEWWIFINHNGKRKAKKIGRDKRLAQEVAKKIEAKLALGEFSLDEKKAIPTFKEYTEFWLKGYVESSLKLSTLISYKSHLKKHIYPVFAIKQLDLITRPEIKDFIFQKAKDKSPKTVKNLVNLLSGIFSHALEDELIKINPAIRLGKLLTKGDTKAKINPLTRDEASILLKTTGKYYSKYYEFLLTALRTGLRLGELIGLQWGDIDFQGQFIEVRRSFVKGRITTPKNHHLRRVDMSNQLTTALLELRKQRKEETLRNGWREVPAWLFINDDGGPLDPDNFRKRVFNRILEKAGLRKIRIHDLRHTYASLLLQQGAKLTYVKEQMGHHSISVTVDIYGHLVPGADRAEVDKLDDNILYMTQPRRN